MKIIFLPGLGQDATVWNNVIGHLNTELSTESLNLFSDIDENTEVTLNFLNKEVDKKLRTIKEPSIYSVWPIIRWNFSVINCTKSE